MNTSEGTSRHVSLLTTYRRHIPYFIFYRLGIRQLYYAIDAYHDAHARHAASTPATKNGVTLISLPGPRALPLGHHVRITALRENEADH